MTTYDATGSLTGLFQRLLLLGVVISATALLLGALVLPTAVAADRAVSAVAGTVLDVPPLADELDQPPVNSVVLAADGTVIAELHDEQNRVPVGLEDIPALVQDAVIATEDADFYRHAGVNHRAIVRAALTNVRSGGIEQGGSTITQQYVRSIPSLGLTGDTIDRKIREAVWAVELERRLSKQEILERYLNTVYFGDGVYGIGTAADHYFSKHVRDLSLPEAAMLAGLIRSPERNNPLDDPEAARARRNIVLDQMRVQGFITREEAEAAKATDLGVSPSQDIGPTQPFFVEWVKQVLYKDGIDLQPEAKAAIGGTQNERRRQLFEGGLVIHTTLDRGRQAIAEATILSYLDDPIADPLASLVTVDPRSGAVLVMASGPKQFGNCPDGVATCELTKVIPAVPGSGGSSREPGSAFKPFVISAALEEGFTPGYETETSSGQAIEGCLTNGRVWRPANYGGGGGGLMNMYEAVRRSNNVYHATLTRDAGVLNVLDVATRMGLEHVPNRGDFGDASCALGLGTAGVYPLEMASAFGTLANRGVHCEPFVVSRIEDREGNLIYQHSPQCERALDRGIADRVNDILQGPPSPGGTAGFVRGRLGRPVAGKTGTTDDWKNAWFMGYVPQMSTAAWIGYEHQSCTGLADGVGCGSMFSVEAGGQTYNRVTGGSIPARLWTDYMVSALDAVPVEDFHAPPPIPSATVPAVVGQTRDAAESALEARKFKPLARTVTHHEPAGQVVNQNPPAGTTAWVGSVVIIEISDGTAEPPRATVPDLLGLTTADARRVLEEQGFAVRVLEKETGDRERDGRIIEQSPAPGEQVEPGTEVVIAEGRFEGGDRRRRGDGGGDGDGGDGDDGGAAPPAPGRAPTPAVAPSQGD